MGNCLKTQLKAEVNNPNLPILETMQQFTLNAIAASGNSTMTDEQKWALNHLFYMVGANGNQTLWNKVKYLFIPMICNDYDLKAMHDYKNNQEYDNISNVTFENHGASFPTQFLKTNISGITSRFVSIIVTMKSKLSNNPNSQFLLGNSPNDFYFSVGNDTANNQYSSTYPSLSAPNNDNYDITSLHNGDDFACMKLQDSNSNNSVLINATSEQINARLQQTLSSATAKFSGVNGYYGLIILAENISSKERDNIMEAAKALKLAFSEIE